MRMISGRGERAEADQRKEGESREGTRAGGQVTFSVLCYIQAVQVGKDRQGSKPIGDVYQWEPIPQIHPIPTQAKR